MALDRTDQVAEAWKIIIARFELTNPSKVNTFRTRYEGHRVVEGQSVVDYLTTMKGYRTHLQLAMPLQDSGRFRRTIAA